MQQQLEYQVSEGPGVHCIVNCPANYISA